MVWKVKHYILVSLFGELREFIVRENEYIEIVIRDLVSGYEVEMILGSKLKDVAEITTPIGTIAVYEDEAINDLLDMIAKELQNALVIKKFEYVFD